MTSKLPYVLAVIPGYIPSIELDVIRPLKYLASEISLQSRVVLHSDFRPHHLDGVDLIWFHRNTEPENLFILAEARKRNIAVYFQMDDNFFALDPAGSIGRFHRAPENIYALEKLIGLADKVRVFSPLLVERISSLNKNISLILPYFDFQAIEGITPDSHEKIRIIYTTSRSGADDDLQIIFNASLKRILQAYSDIIEVYFWGPAPRDQELRNHPSVRHLPFVSGYDAYIKHFYQMAFDIGLAPMESGIFFNSKTNNKFREFGACGVAGIYSDVPLYQNCVKHGENGFLIRNTEEDWYSAIQKMIEEASLRKSIAIQARTDVQEQYSFTKYCQRLAEDLASWHMYKAEAKDQGITRKVNHVSIHYGADFSNDPLLTIFLNEWVRVLRRMGYQTISSPSLQMDSGRVDMNTEGPGGTILFFVGKTEGDKGLRFWFPQTKQTYNFDWSACYPYIESDKNIYIFFLNKLALLRGTFVMAEGRSRSLLARYKRFAVLAPFPVKAVYFFVRELYKWPQEYRRDIRWCFRRLFKKY